MMEKIGEQCKASPIVLLNLVTCTLFLESVAWLKRSPYLTLTLCSVSPQKIPLQLLHKNLQTKSDLCPKEGNRISHQTEIT